MAEATDPVITKSMLDEALRESSESTIDEIAGIVNAFAAHMDERFNKVETDIADLNTKYDHLITTLDAFLKRLDDQERENVARDAQLERLDIWVHQVAERLQMELR